MITLEKHNMDKIKKQLTPAKVACDECGAELCFRYPHFDMRDSVREVLCPKCGKQDYMQV